MGTSARAWTRLMASVFCALALGSVSQGQSYMTILDSSEDQTPQGVRGAGGDNVLLAASYTPSGGEPQGMWWLGSLTTGSGTAYKVSPNIGGQTVTSSLYYGPNTFEFDPSLGVGNIRVVGSYQYEESTQFNNGVLYTGPLDGSGTWQQINVPDAITGGTVANTIPHSVMGSIVVGNYDLSLGGNATGLGNAFLYNIATNAWTIFDTPFGGTDKLTSAYGIWQNGIGSTSYTIAGGSAADAGIDKAFLIDYDSNTGVFSNLTYFYDGSPAGLTHFEGITGAVDGYNLVGIDGDGYGFASVTRLGNGTFGPANWTGPLSYPGSTMTTGNTVVGNQAIGIYMLESDPAIYAYVTAVPEPSMTGLAAIGVGLASAAWRRRRRPLAGHGEQACSPVPLGIRSGKRFRFEGGSLCSRCSVFLRSRSCCFWWWR